MAFGRDNTQLLKTEGVIYIGNIPDPENVGQDNIDPISKFVITEELGIFRQGTFNADFAREFAELLAGTPAILEQKSLTRKMFNINVELVQWNIDLLELVFGFNTQKAYSITSPSVKSIDIAHIGSAEPAQGTNGFLWDTYLEDGRRFYIIMYAGKATSEDLSITLSGTDFAGYNAKFEAFPHPNFTGSCTDAQKHYGALIIDSAVVC